MSDFSAKIKAILDTKDIPQQLKGIENNVVTLKHFKLDTSSLPSEIQASLDKHKFKINIDGIKASSINTGMKNVGDAAGQSLSKSLVGRINSALSNGGIEASIAKVSAQYDKLGSTGHTKLSQIKTDIESLKRLQGEMGNAKDNASLVANYEKFSDTLSKVKNNLATVSAESKTTVSALQIQSLDNKMAAWMEKNSKAAKEFGADVENLRNKLNSLDRTGDGAAIQFDTIKNDFDYIDKMAEAKGKKGASFLSGFKNAFQSISKYVSASSVIYQSINALQQMYSNVVNIDSALTELKKVSSATDSQLASTFENSKNNAKKFAMSLSDMISATADWSRLGYSLSEAEELAQASALYKNVGDNIDIDTANQSLISTLQGFQLDSSEAESIIDKFNEVANNYAIDSAGIGEALQRSAASFNAANTDLSKSIALITGTNEVVQDPARVGNMWKTVSMRIRGTKQELEAAGEDTDGMVESTSELRDLVKGLTGFDIMADSAGTEFKDIYDIVVGIGEQWGKLSDTDQAGLLESLAGKNHGNALAAALGNIEQIKKAYNTAEYESEGSARKENEAYMDSIRGKLGQLQLAWESLSAAFLNADFLKNLIDAGTVVLEVLTQLVDKIGLFGTVIAGAAIAKGIKSIS